MESGCTEAYMSSYQLEPTLAGVESPMLDPGRSVQTSDPKSHGDYDTSGVNSRIGNTEWLGQVLRLSLPVYLLIIVGVGFVFTTANALTKQEGHLTFYSEIFSILLYMSSVGALLWLEFAVISGKVVRPHNYTNDVASGGSHGIEYEMTEKEEVEKYHKKHKHNRKKGVNFYFLIGGIAFAIGAILHDVFFIVDFSLHGDKSCLHPADIVTSVTRMLFMGILIVFITLHHGVVITKDTLGVRFLFVHVIATNICLWINCSVNEAAEDFRHDEEDRKRKEGLADLNTTTSCYASRELRTLAAPYLTPCRIEFALFAIAVLYQMLSHVDSQPADTKVEEQSVTSPEGRHRKILRVFRTLHVGCFLFVTTLVAVGLFFNYSDFLDDTESAQLVFHGTEISLLLILTTSVVVGFVCMRSLCFVPHPTGSLDENLLIVAVVGQILYDVSRVIASVGGVTSDQSSPVFSLTAGILSLIELSFQTVFILFTCRLCSENEKQESEKPGRACIGFVLLGNLSMWLLVTFEAKKATMVPLYIEFYGYLPWALIAFTLTPMMIFYRFHSTVLLSDIWKEAYEKRKTR